jgi:tetratricopeptide (TPR) repeat protein
LFERCWKGVIVGEDSLNRAIFELRRALRSVGAAEMIETIPKTGYRLTGLGHAQTAEAASNASGMMSRRWLIGGIGSVALGTAAALVIRRRASSAPPDRSEALVERADIIQRDDLPDAAEQSAALYRQALRLKPNDARILGKLALVLGHIAEYAPRGETAKAVQATELAARRALDLQPGLADARVALAMLPPHFGAWLPVERTLRGILADAPDNLAAAKGLALVLMEVGRVKAGAEIIDQLVKRVPLSPDLQYRHAYQLWARGRLAEADLVADKSLQLWPRHSAVWLARMWLFALTGRPAAALAMLADRDGLPEFPPPMIELLRICCTALKTRSHADIAQAIRANAAAARNSPFGVVSATLTLPQLGAAHVAYEINKGYLVRKGPLVGRLHRGATDPPVSEQSRRKTMALWMPAAAPLRDYPAFLSLCAATGLTAYWEASSHWPDFLNNRPPPAS